MTRNWKKYKLSEIIELIGGGTPKTSNPEYWNGNIPWLSVVDFGRGVKHVHKTEKSITEKGLKESSTKILKKGQIIISARGTVGELAMLGTDMAFNQSCYGITANQKTDNDFLYYLLKSSVERVKKKTHGAVFDTITKQTFENIEVEIPEDLKTQSRIASILSSLDNKIELNLQMNQTLEAMAQAIFKEWFVDFKFPGSSKKLVNGLPKGWSTISIGELFQLTIGGDWGQDELSDDFPTHVSVVRGTDFSDILNGSATRVPLRYIKEKNFEKRAVQHGDLLLEISGGSKDQPTGRTILFTTQLLSLFPKPVVPASFCRLIRPHRIEESVFLNAFFNLFYSMGGTWEYQNQSTGLSNFQFTYFSENKKLALPDDRQLIIEFGKIVSPMLNKMHENLNQVQILTQTRDSLLPKLMNGTIEVKA